MNTGLALRSTVFGTSSIAKLIPLIEASEVDSVWFPSVGTAFDSIDMCAIFLGGTRRLQSGTGVIKSGSQNLIELTARSRTLTEASDGRFILGIGTGPEVGGTAIDGLVKLTSRLRASYPEGRKQRVFFAALRRKILDAAYQYADGAILNFCSPTYAAKIRSERQPPSFTLGCYIKLFFAEKDATAKKILVDEVKMYARLPQYRAMFGEMNLLSAIDGPSFETVIPKEVQDVTRANPSDADIMEILQRFRAAGVNLPIIYPYVSGDETYKRSVIQRLVSLKL